MKKAFFSYGSEMPKRTLSVSMKINGTITAKKNNSRYTMTGNKSGTGTSLKKEFAFDTPGYDIIHFKGVYTVGSKKFNIDTDI